MVGFVGGGGAISCVWIGWLGFLFMYLWWWWCSFKHRDGEEERTQKWVLGLFACRKREKERKRKRKRNSRKRIKKNIKKMKKIEFGMLSML